MKRERIDGILLRHESGVRPKVREVHVRHVAEGFLEGEPDGDDILRG
jgi:hypothetical protein